MTDEILFDVSEGIATITLNRPDKLNSVTRPMYDDLNAMLDETDARDDVRAVIVTGAGRAFCAGADMSGSAFDYEAKGIEPATGVVRDRGGEFTLRVFRSLKPIIAAINGAAVGFGASSTLAMDFRLMADDAKTGFVFGARGIAPEAASSWFLQKIVGLPQALDWCLTGRMFPASEALSAGLVRSIHPKADVVDAARELATTIATNVAPVSAVMIRQMLWQMAAAPHPMSAHNVDSAAVASLGKLADAKEGVAAFFEKRPAEWSLKPSEDLPGWFPWAAEPPFEPPRA